MSEPMAWGPLGPILCAVQPSDGKRVSRDLLPLPSSAEVVAETIDRIASRLGSSTVGSAAVHTSDSCDLRSLASIQTKTKSSPSSSSCPSSSSPTQFTRWTSQGAMAWLWLVIMSLNIGFLEYSPVAQIRVPDRPSKAQAEALESLARRVIYFLELDDARLPVKNWKEYLESRNVTYSGEQVLTAMPLSWAQVEPALPPAHQCACVDALALAEGAVRSFLEKPEEALPFLTSASTRPRPGRMMMQPGERLSLAKGALGRGLVVPLVAEELIWIGDSPLTNGWFGVGKGTHLPDNHPSHPGAEVLRLIMNLTASNSFQETFAGDIDGLPYIGQWRCIFLEDDNYLSWNAEDLKGCFYIFRLPRGWARNFAFDEVFTRGELELTGPPDEKVWLGAVVIPMGWLSAMGVAQYLHRRLVLAYTGSPTSFPLAREVRKDKIFPLLCDLAVELARLWQIYADDLDVMEVLRVKDLARLPECQPGSGRLRDAAVEALRKALAAGQAGHDGKVHEWMKAARCAYDHWNVPRSVNKAQESKLLLRRLGGLVDGIQGYVGPDGPRCGLLLGLSLELLGNGYGGMHALKVAFGHWTSVMIYRKETSSGLNRAWSYLRPEVRKPGRDLMPGRLGEEILRTCCLLPLMRMDLRLRTSRTVTVSDASEAGGGVCASVGLTTSGAQEFLQELGSDAAVGRDAIGLIGLCDGIGGARRALDLLGVECALYASSEVDEAARKVVRAAWPSVVDLGDLTKIDKGMLLALRSKAPHLRLLLITLGSPCQDLSGANVNAMGIEGTRSSLVFVCHEVVALIRRVFNEPVKVRTMVENVKSMDSHGPSARLAFSHLWKSRPLAICSGDLSEVRRPRYYWVDWPIRLGEGASLQDVGSHGVVKLVANGPAWSRFLEDGAKHTESWQGQFATFMRSIPRKRPPPRPLGVDKCDDATIARWEAMDYCYPPYQMKESNCVVDKGVLRPLTYRERSVRMGFPRDHLTPAIGKSERLNAKEKESLRSSLIGNAFHTVVVAWVLGTALADAGVLQRPPTVEECWGIHKKSMARGEAIARRWGPLEVALPMLAVQLYHRSATHRGSDVRLATGTLHDPRCWPRQSVPVGRWKWRVVVAYKRQGAHINALELRAVLAAVKWRARTPGNLNARFLHLSDSQVCLGVLVKGRSSSGQLFAILQRLNHLVLAANFVPAYGYVVTHLNPADAPSRWLIDK